MHKRQNIHLLYKKLGETPKEAILRYKKENPEYDEEKFRNEYEQVKRQNDALRDDIKEEWRKIFREAEE